MKIKAHRVNPRTQNSEVGEAELAKDSGMPNEIGGNPDGSVSWKPGPGKDRNQIHICCCVISPSVVSNSLDPMDCSTQAPLSMEFSRQEYWRGLPFPAPLMLLRGQLNRDLDILPSFWQQGNHFSQDAHLIFLTLAHTIPPKGRELRNQIGGVPPSHFKAPHLAKFHFLCSFVESISHPFLKNYLNW